MLPRKCLTNLMKKMVLMRKHNSQKKLTLEKIQAWGLWEVTMFLHLTFLFWLVIWATRTNDLNIVYLLKGVNNVKIYFFSNMFNAQYASKGRSLLSAANRQDKIKLRNFNSAVYCQRNIITKHHTTFYPKIYCQTLWR